MCDMSLLETQTLGYDKKRGRGHKCTIQPRFNLLSRFYLASSDLTMGLMKRSYFGGLRVKPSPTKQTLVTNLFQAFFCLFPVLMTLSTSVSPWARTFGSGTSHLPWGTHHTLVDHLYNPLEMKPFIHQHWGRYLQLSLSSSAWSCWRGP